VKGVGEPGDREGHARIDEEESETWAAATRAGGRKPPTEVDRPTPHRRGCATRRLLTLLRQGNSAHVFEQINRYVHERLALFASKQHRQVGRGWKTRYPTSWLRELGVFRLSGTRGGRALHATR
jgi:hypothetical protein